MSCNSSVLSIPSQQTVSTISALGKNTLSLPRYHKSLTQLWMPKSNIYWIYIYIYAIYKSLSKFDNTSDGNNTKCFYYTREMNKKKAAYFDRIFLHHFKISLFNVWTSLSFCTQERVHKSFLPILSWFPKVNSPAAADMAAIIQWAPTFDLTYSKPEFCFHVLDISVQQSSL